MAVGEVGDERRSLATVAAYTSGGDKLQMCYTFDLLGPEFSAAHVRKCVTAFEAAGRRRLDLLGLLQPRRGAPCLALDASRATTPTRSPNSRSSCWFRCAARSAFTRARSSGWRRPRSPSRICAIPTASASGPPSRAATAAARRWSGKRQAECRLHAPASRGCRCRRRIAAGGRAEQRRDHSSVLAHYREAGVPPRASGAGRRRHRVPRRGWRRAGLHPLERRGEAALRLQFRAARRRGGSCPPACGGADREPRRKPVEDDRLAGRPVELLCANG